MPLKKPYASKGMLHMQSKRIAAALIALYIAALHRKTSWGYWLTMTTGMLYIIGALRLMIITLRDPSGSGALPVYTVGAAILAALMLQGARKCRTVPGL